MKRPERQTTKIQSFKTYTITGCCVFLFYFIIVQFLAKPYIMSDDFVFFHEKPLSYMKFILLAILGIWAVVQNIIYIYKNYVDKKEYNKKLSILYIMFSCVLILITIFVW